MTIGANIRAAREAAGMTQIELAARAGMTQGTLSQYERGHVEPRLATLARLADALGVTVAELVG